MTSVHPIDWDPTTESFIHNDMSAFDEVRGRRPVAHGPDGHFTALTHGESLEVLLDPDTYSSAVSRFPSVPNGMDLPEHTPFRAIVDTFYSPKYMEGFEHVCRRIVRNLIAQIPRDQEVDFMDVFARPFANEVQCAFMGWPSSLHQPLQDWVQKNQAATRSQDREAMSHVAREFDGFIRHELAVRRSGENTANDVTAELLAAKVEGRALTDDEIVSIIRNWTVGELGTIASSVGLIAHFLATRPDDLDYIKTLHAQKYNLAFVTDEILRITSPFISSRRKATRDVHLGGKDIPAGSRVNVNWAAANRDEKVFEDPDRFDMTRHHDANLLYGAGIHVCPGKPLAHLELRIVLEELLDSFAGIALGTQKPLPAQFPGSGFASLQLRFLN